MKIITNNIPRHLVYGYQLTDEQKAEFDYIDQDEIDSHDFFIYKGFVYDLDEAMRIEHNEDLKGWDGYYSDSYFSGIVIKIVDGDSVIVGRYVG